MVRICDSEQREPRNSPWLFSFSWEQRKLREIVERVVRKNTNNESTLPLTISAQYGLVDQITYFNNRVASRDISNYYLVLNGEFAYNKSTSDGFPFGAVKRLDLYPKGVLSTLYIVFSLRDQEQISSDFLSVFFDTDRWHRGVAERAAEGARNHGLLNISTEDFFDIDLRIPKEKREQDKIGALFRGIDHLITLHQRKYDKLSKIKKSMLEKLFPKNGSNVPEIRFAGFTDAWEQRKFEKSFSLLQNNTLSRADLSESSGIAADIHYGDVLIKFGEYLDMAQETFPWIKSLTDADKFKTSFLQDGDVVFADTAEDETAGKCCEIRNCGTMVIVSGLHTIPCRPESKFAPGYLGYYLNSMAFHKQLVPLMQGTKVVSISKAALKSTVIQYPSDDKEQQKIGQFFKYLDRLITLHQRKLEKLKKIKQSCLEKMFV